jgi:hypothetical protein
MDAQSTPVLLLAFIHWQDEALLANSSKNTRRLGGCDVLLSHAKVPE